jgi:hypothetical protein
MKCKFTLTVQNGCLHRKLTGTQEIVMHQGDPYAHPAALAATLLSKLDKDYLMEGHTITFKFYLPKKKK